MVSDSKRKWEKMHSEIAVPSRAVNTVEKTWIRHIRKKESRHSEKTQSDFS